MQRIYFTICHGGLADRTEDARICSPVFQTLPVNVPFSDYKASDTERNKLDENLSDININERSVARKTGPVSSQSGRAISQDSGPEKE